MSSFDRAARSLEDALRHELSGLPPEIYRDAVRRILVSIREPGDEVISAGALQLSEGAAVEVDLAQMRAAWARMVDTLLADVG